MKALFVYFNMVLSVTLDSVPFSFTSIFLSFLTYIFYFLGKRFNINILVERCKNRR